MTVDFFLIDAPHVVPEEFRTWKAAKAQHRAVFLRCISAQAGGAEQTSLEAEDGALRPRPTALSVSLARPGAEQPGIT